MFILRPPVWRKQGEAKPKRLRGIPAQVVSCQHKFSWRHAWKCLHTQSSWAPPFARHVWWILHAMGSTQGSEAFCESIGSLLKLYGQKRRRVSAAKADEKTRLRLAGLKGDGTDDVFLQRIFAEMFGSAENIKLFYKNRAARERRYPLGKGSKTLHNVRLKAKTIRKWSWKRIRSIKRVTRGPVSVTSMRNAASSHYKEAG